MFPLNAYLRTFCSIFVFSYSAISSTVIRYLHCVDVADQSVVNTVPAIHCGTEKYNR